MLLLVVETELDHVEPRPTQPIRIREQLDDRRLPAFAIAAELWERLGRTDEAELSRAELSTLS